MKWYGIQKEVAQEIAESLDINVEIEQRGVEKTYYLVRLKPKGESYRKVNPVTGKKIYAVCFHGHFHFIRRLFLQFPDAKCITSFATYNGKDDFMDKYNNVGRLTVGSILTPYSLSECCHCYN